MIARHQSVLQAQHQAGNLQGEQERECRERGCLLGAEQAACVRWQSRSATALCNLSLPSRSALTHSAIAPTCSTPFSLMSRHFEETRLGSSWVRCSATSTPPCPAAGEQQRRKGECVRSTTKQQRDEKAGWELPAHRAPRAAFLLLRCSWLLPILWSRELTVKDAPADCLLEARRRVHRGVQRHSKGLVLVAGPLPLRDARRQRPRMRERNRGEARKRMKAKARAKAALHIP